MSTNKLQWHRGTGDVTDKVTEMHVSVVRVIKLELWQYLHLSKPQVLCSIWFWGCQT